MTDITILSACIEMIDVRLYLVKYTLLDDVNHNISSRQTAQLSEPITSFFIAFLYKKSCCRQDSRLYCLTADYLVICDFAK